MGRVVKVTIIILSKEGVEEDVAEKAINAWLISLRDQGVIKSSQYTIVSEFTERTGKVEA